MGAFEAPGPHAADPADPFQGFRRDPDDAQALLPGQGLQAGNQIGLGGGGGRRGHLRTGGDKAVLDPEAHEAGLGNGERPVGRGLGAHHRLLHEKDAVVTGRPPEQAVVVGGLDRLYGRRHQGRQQENDYGQSFEHDPRSGCSHKGQQPAMLLVKPTRSYADQVNSIFSIKIYGWNAHHYIIDQWNLNIRGLLPCR